MARHSGRIAIVALIALLGGAGCGEDEGGGGGGNDADKAKKKAESDKKKADKKAKAEAKKSKSKKKVEVASSIPTLENTVPEAEKGGIRRKLKERDFSVDVTGTENRDPFRSYVLPQVSVDESSSSAPPVITSAPTEQCTKNQMVAPGHAITDLELIGILRKGAIRYALFRDPKGVGHLVARDNCLGREKAKIKEIGETIVCHEIQPEVPPDATTVPEPKKDCIALHPEEITVDGEEDEDAPPNLAPTVAPEPPPPSLPPPSVAPPSPMPPPKTDGTGM